MPGICAAGTALADAGLGEFHRHPQLDLGQHRVEPGVAGLLGQPLGGDLEPRQRRPVELPSSRPSLSASSTSSALRPLATARFLRSVGSRRLAARSAHRRVEIERSAGGGRGACAASPAR